MLSVFIGIVDAYYVVSQRDLKAQSEVHLWVGRHSKLALAGEQVFQSKQNLSFPPSSNFYPLIFTIS